MISLIDLSNLSENHVPRIPLSDPIYDEISVHPYYIIYIMLIYNT